MKKYIIIPTLLFAIFLTAFIYYKLNNDNKILSVTPVNNTKLTKVDYNADTKIGTKKTTFKKQFPFILDNKIILPNKNFDSFCDITPSNISEDETISSVYFINPKTGYAATFKNDRSISIYNTIDGGKTWKVQGITLKGFPDICFLDESTGWLLVYQDAGMMHVEVTLFYTDDKAKTWNTASHSDTQNNDTATIPFIGDKTGFSFADKNNGYLAGYWPVSNKAYFFATEDSGKSWHEKALSYPQKYKDSMISTEPPMFFSENEGLLFASICTDKMNYVFYKTNDGGKSWTSNSVIKLTFTESPKYSFFNINEGYITDGKSLYYTKDSGNTWKTAAENMNFSNVINFMFCDINNGVIISDKTIYKTSDRGRTWNIAQILQSR